MSTLITLLVLLAVALALTVFYFAARNVQANRFAEFLDREVEKSFAARELAYHEGRDERDIPWPDVDQSFDQLDTLWPWQYNFKSIVVYKVDRGSNGC